MFIKSPPVNQVSPRVVTRLIAEQTHAILSVSDLQVMGHLQRPLTGLQLGDVLGGEEAHLAQTLALPPVRVGGVDHSQLVARSVEHTRRKMRASSSGNQFFFYKLAIPARDDRYIRHL